MAKARTEKGAKKSTRKRRPKKAEANTSGLTPESCALDVSDASIAASVARVKDEGGIVVGAYKDPKGGTPLLIAIVPSDSVAPTPFQRDLSDTHHKRLADVIEKTGRFLDPIIVVTAPEKGFWTPNGRHRLAAMQRLGARAITVLFVPERSVAWQILALNTEKAHNLKERSLEVVRIYRDLVATDSSEPEEKFSFYLEDPALVTLGVCYEKNGRFAGAAYYSVLRRVEHFTDDPLKSAIKVHEALAEKTLEVEARVTEVMGELRARGFQSPYLRSFVVARINPIRFMKGEPPPAMEVLESMLAKAKKFSVDKVKQEDIARTGGAPDEDG